MHAWIVVSFAIGAGTMVHGTNKAHIAIQVILETMVVYGLMDGVPFMIGAGTMCMYG
jgi:hypothetical protein